MKTIYTCILKAPAINKSFVSLICCIKTIPLRPSRPRYIISIIVKGVALQKTTIFFRTLFFIKQSHDKLQYVAMFIPYEASEPC